MTELSNASIFLIADELERRHHNRPGGYEYPACRHRPNTRLSWHERCLECRSELWSMLLATPPVKVSYGLE